MTPQGLIDNLLATRPMMRNKIRFQREDNVTALMVMAEKASNANGARWVERQKSLFGGDLQTQRWLDTAIRNGKDRRAARAEERKVAAKQDRAQRQSMSVLRAKTVATSLVDALPEIAAQWDYDKNLDPDGNVVNPSQVAWKANSNVWFKCEHGHSFRYRLNNRTNLASKGRDPGCQVCNGTRQAAFLSYRDLIAQDLGAISESWESLPDAVKYAILVNRGDLDGNDFQRTLALNLASGKVSLSSVLNAELVEQIDVDLSINDDDAEFVRTVTDDDVHASVQQEKTYTAKTLLDGLALVTDGSAVAEVALRETVNALWNLDEDIESMRTADLTDFQRKVLDLYLAERDAALSLELPEGWGEVDPTLMQRRFALFARENEKVFNLSGTGTGKTYSAVLACANSTPVLLTVPANTVEQWKNSIKACLPGASVSTNLSQADWMICSHDRFSTQDIPEGLHFNAVIIDEVHRFKTETAKRRIYIETLLSDVMVCALSATPVITDIKETVSLITLVRGEKPELNTRPTIKNMMAAHYALMEYSIRFMPTKRFAVRSDHFVQVDPVHVLNSVGNANLHPSVMDKAMLDSKLSALSDLIGNEPTVIYTKYVTDIVEPVATYLAEQGYSVGIFTGSERDGKESFINGEHDVLIGSDAIMTGVDGLQHRSANMVILAPPFTSADDDQIVGRLDRTGQTKPVTVKYVLSHFGEWSYDRGRKNRVNFRRSMADAVVDGKVADGVLLESEEHAARREFDTLAQMVDSA